MIVNDGPLIVLALVLIVVALVFIALEARR